VPDLHKIAKRAVANSHVGIYIGANRVSQVRFLLGAPSPEPRPGDARPGGVRSIELRLARLEAAFLRAVLNHEDRVLDIETAWELPGKRGSRQGGARADVRRARGEGPAPRTWRWS